MEHIKYKTRGTCSQAIEFDVADGRVYNTKFIGGCRGNTQGVAALAEGMKIEDVIDRCQGILCREGTSCPDQFAKALSQVVASQEESGTSNTGDKAEACPRDGQQDVTEGLDPDCANCPTPCGREKLQEI